MNISQLSSAMVSMLFGGGGVRSGSIASSNPLVELQRVRAPGAQDKGIAQERKDPVTITAIKQFETAVSKAKDLDTALKDPRVLNVLLPAFGLSDQADYPGLVSKALQSDPKDTKGLLASLDDRFKAAATTLDLKAKGLAGLKDPKVLKSLEDGYVQYQYQKGLDATTPGMSDVLYFLKNAANAKTPYDVLGNAITRRVVTGALGLPPDIALQQVESQARAITSRLDLKDLQDPKKVAKMAERYLVNLSYGS